MKKKISENTSIKTKFITFKIISWQKKIVEKMSVELIFKICQYETNYSYNNDLRNFVIRYWFRMETGFGGKLVSQENWFLVTLAKTFVIKLVVKQITYNAKVSDITILWFFGETKQMAVICKKQLEKWVKGSWEWNI